MSQSLKKPQFVYCDICKEKIQVVKLRKFGVGKFCKTCYSEVSKNPAKFGKFIYDCSYNICSTCPCEC